MKNYTLIKEYEKDEFIPTSKLYLYLISRDNSAHRFKENFSTPKRKAIKFSKNKLTFLNIPLIHN